MTPEQKQQRIAEIRRRLSVDQAMLPTRDEADFLLSLVSQEADSDLADIEWALVELADGWINFQEREGPHGFYQNARRVLNAIGEDNASRMRSACVAVAKDFQRMDYEDFRRKYKTAMLILALESVSIQEQEAKQ